MAGFQMGQGFIDIGMEFAKVNRGITTVQDQLGKMSKMGASHVGILHRGWGSFTSAVGSFNTIANRTFQAFKWGALGATAGVAALSAGIGKLVFMASDAEETGSKFNVVFDKNADAVREWAGVYAKEVGRSKFEMMGFMATLQDTFKPFGFASDHAKDLTEQVTKLAYDLASFNNKSDTDTFADLQSALVGNAETMRKYGVVINDAALDAELMRMGIKGGSDAANEQTKVLARLNLILAGTTDAQGDAVRTAGSFANSWKGLQGTVIDTATTFGNVFLPYATQVVQWLKDMAPSAEQLSAIIVVLKEEMVSWYDVAFRAFEGVAGLFGASIVDGRKWAASWKVTALEWALAFSGTYDTLKGIFVSTGQLFVWLWHNWDNLLADAMLYTASVLNGLYDNFVNFFKSLWEYMKTGQWGFDWTPLTQGFQSSLEELPEIAKNFEPGAISKALAGKLADQVKKEYDAATGQFKKLDLTGELKKTTKEGKDAKGVISDLAGIYKDMPGGRQKSGGGNTLTDSIAAFQNLQASVLQQNSGVDPSALQKQTAANTTEIATQSKEQSKQSKTMVTVLKQIRDKKNVAVLG